MTDSALVCFSENASETGGFVRCGERYRAPHLPLPGAGANPGPTALRQDCHLADMSARLQRSQWAEYLRTFRLRLPVRLSEQALPVITVVASLGHLPASASSVARGCRGPHDKGCLSRSPIGVCRDMLSCRDNEHAATGFVFRQSGFKRRSRVGCQSTTLSRGRRLFTRHFTFCSHAGKVWLHCVNEQKEPEGRIHLSWRIACCGIQGHAARRRMEHQDDGVYCWRICVWFHLPLSEEGGRCNVG